MCARASVHHASTHTRKHAYPHSHTCTVHAHTHTHAHKNIQTRRRRRRQTRTHTNAHAPARTHAISLTLYSAHTSTLTRTHLHTHTSTHTHTLSLTHTCIHMYIPGRSRQKCASSCIISSSILWPMIGLCMATSKSITCLNPIAVLICFSFTIRARSTTAAWMASRVLPSEAVRSVRCTLTHISPFICSQIVSC